MDWSARLRARDPGRLELDTAVRSKPAGIVWAVHDPGSRSFPSGHTAAALAFASGARRVLPAASVPLHALAALVGYSRVHTGVHYPGDVLGGALLAAVLADVTASTPAKRWS